MKSSIEIIENLDRKPLERISSTLTGMAVENHSHPCPTFPAHSAQSLCDAIQSPVLFFDCFHVEKVTKWKTAEGKLKETSDVKLSTRASVPRLAFISHIQLNGSMTMCLPSLIQACCSR